MLMLVGYGNNEEVIKITSSGIEVKEDETFISAPQGNTWEQILREMQDLATQARTSQTDAAASADRAAASEQVAVSKAAEIADAAEQTLANAQAAAQSAAEAAASAASIDTSVFATAAQGEKADSAVQTVNGKPGPNPSLTALDVGAPEVAWSNLKTYTNVTQLGLTSGEVTTAQVFDAMPDKSAAMLVDSDVSDPPNNGCVILIYRYSSPRGRATAYTSRGTTDYIMLIRSRDPAYGLTGEWVQL